jgi:FkbM family methyltransferase
MELRRVVLSLPGKLASFTAGTGLSKLPLVGLLHGFLYKLLKPVGIVLVDVHGSKMYVDSRDTGVAPFLLEWGFYEKYETAIFESVVRKGMVVVDIGANIGYYTLLASHLVGEEGKVFAFEPDPSNYDLLLRNIEINNCTNIIPVRKAISSKSGRMKLFLDKSNLGGHSLQEANVESNEFVTVDIVRLDDFFRNMSYKIDVIKMDVQGSEMNVLEGMASIVNRNDNLKILTEFWPTGLQNAGSSPLGFLKKLVEYGFVPYRIDQNITSIDICHLSSISHYGGAVSLFCEKRLHNAKKLFS